MASLTLLGYGRPMAGDTLCPDNGGNSGAGYWRCVHPATQRSIQLRCAGRFSLGPALCTVRAELTRPRQRLSICFVWLYNLKM